MKYFIINTESFSPKGLGSRRDISEDDFPQWVKDFLQAYPSPFIILDESSKIKTTEPCAERKKSTRTRLIKKLSRYGQRCAMTGTLMTKSPCNIIDQYQFLDEDLFPEGMYQFAEKHCVMETLHIGRGRRVVMPEHSSGERNSWTGIRRRLKNAYNIGGKERVRYAMQNIANEYSISMDNMKWIATHEKYTPFRNVEELRERVAYCTATVRRSDVMDTTNEEFVHKPIVRKFQLSASQKKLYKSLVELGFTDSMVLGKSAAMELQMRLMDICCGFEPVSPCMECPYNIGGLRSQCPHRAECDKPAAGYNTMKENPKLDAVMEMLEEIGTDENTVVIWSARRHFANALKERLDQEGITWCAYTGDETTEQKEAAAEAFSTGRARVCIANQASAGYGVNFMKDCSYAIYACCNSSVEQDEQSKSRLLRGELKEPKYCYRIIADGSMEEKVINALDLGRELLGDENRKEMFTLREER